MEARGAEIEVLRAELGAERELRRRQELRLAELERRLGMDSTDSGTPTSKERIGAKEARRHGRNRNGSAGRTAGEAVSPATREKDWPGIRIRIRRRPRIRRRSAVPAGRPWTVPGLRARGGRRSSTWSSPGR